MSSCSNLNYNTCIATGNTLQLNLGSELCQSWEKILPYDTSPTRAITIVSTGATSDKLWQFYKIGNYLDCKITNAYIIN